MEELPTGNATRNVVVRMNVGTAFGTLTDREKLYAHHLSRAAWMSARIILEQVSPESSFIFDLILELHRICAGDWSALAKQQCVDEKQIQAFVEYAATFLSNIGNFYGRGDQKFVPKISTETFDRLASISVRTNELRAKIGDALLSESPSSLGYPSTSTQSQYYPDGAGKLDKRQIQAISKLMERKGLWPENTRLQFVGNETSHPIIDILQASVQSDEQPKVLASELEISGTKYLVRVKRGDFTDSLSRVCDELKEALEYANEGKHSTVIRDYIESFESGDLEAYRESQRVWVKDMNPKVENIFGFVEPYRDPAGIRAEFEAVVAIEDSEESTRLKLLVDRSSTFICRLPWAKGYTENNGKGPFEKKLFEAPSFASIHTLAYCSTIMFDGMNLPNYNDIRQTHGFKNVVIANRLAAGSQHDALSSFVDEPVKQSLKRYSAEIGYLCIVIHELLGHGTGQMMIQEDTETFSFDHENPPINPLTGLPIESWYRPDQTWTGQFGDIATSVDECRCELVGAFLIGDADVLGLFGYDESSELKPQDVTYLFYVRLCALALLELSHYIPENKKWGQAHARAHFAMLNCLLRDKNGGVVVDHQPEEARLTVKVDRALVLTHGRKALEKMLLHLHMYRVTADVDACRPYFEDLSAVEHEHLEWRKTVSRQNIPRLLYVHANTFLGGQSVALKEYDATEVGLIESWVDRNL